MRIRMGPRPSRKNAVLPHALPSRRSPLPPTHRCTDEPPPGLTPAELALALGCEICLERWAEQLADDVRYHDPSSLPEGDYEALVAALRATKSYEDRLYVEQELPGVDLPLWPLIPPEEDC